MDTNGMDTNGMDTNGMDTKKRTLLKIAIWAGLAFSTTIASAYAINNTIDTSMKIAAIDFTIKITMHIAYERIWQHISWGKSNPQTHSLPTNVIDVLPTVP
jgi:uncharacterized membrane protein